MYAQRSYAPALQTTATLKPNMGHRTGGREGIMGKENRIGDEGSGDVDGEGIEGRMKWKREFSGDERNGG